MLTENKRDINTKVIEILSKDPGLTVEQIASKLKNSPKASTATIYRHISDLVEQQHIFRYQKKFFLHRLWVEELARQCQKLQVSLAKQDRMGGLLPRRAGDMRRYKAPSMILLDSIWNSVVLQIASESAGQPRYGYNSNAWHAISVSESEKSLYQSTIERDCEVFLLYGNANSFNEKAVEEFSSERIHTRISKKHGLPNDGYIAWAQGPFVLECQLPTDLVTMFSKVIRQANMTGEINRKEVTRIFSKRTEATCLFTVLKSPKRADALRDVLSAKFH